MSRFFLFIAASKYLAVLGSFISPSALASNLLTQQSGSSAEAFISVSAEQGSGICSKALAALFLGLQVCSSLITLSKASIEGEPILIRESSAASRTSHVLSVFKMDAKGLTARGSFLSPNSLAAASLSFEFQLFNCLISTSTSSAATIPAQNTSRTARQKRYFLIGILPLSDWNLDGCKPNSHPT